MKILSKVLDYLIPIVFLSILLLIGSFLIMDLNHMDPSNFHTFIVVIMIVYWPMTIGALSFVAGLGVANLFYKWTKKQD
jgi:hypothetical protein